MSELARGMAVAQNRLELLDRQIQQQMAVMHRLWGGPDAAQFARLWESVHRPRLQLASSSLADTVSLVERNRDAQIETSAGDGGPGSLVGFQGNGPRIDGPGLTPEQLAMMTPAEVRAFYEDRALGLLGTTAEGWQPGRGLDHNRDLVEGVVDVYADFYRTDPETYMWAGMASMIWASLYAGVEDLNDIGNAAGAIERISEIDRLTPGGSPLAPLTELTAEELAAEAVWYEERLLTMQQEVFLDQAVTHEAYRDGGLEAVELLLEDDPYNYGPETLEAWRLIDEGNQTGNTDLVAEGSRQLLMREQFAVLQDDYDAMRSRRPPIGEAMTYLMTMTGSPSIPGAESFADLYPVTVDSEVSISVPFLPDPTVGVTVETPLPDGNLADFNDRWRLIEEDTLPAYLELAQDPDQVLAIIDVPVDERADDYRIINQLDDIAGRFDTDFSVGLDG